MSSHSFRHFNTSPEDRIASFHESCIPAFRVSHYAEIRLL